MYVSVPISQLLEEWLAWAEWANAENRDESLAKNLTGFDEFCWIVEHDPEKAWLAILAAMNDPRYFQYHGNLAAGPLEDLIAKHSDLIIDRVEALANKDEIFRSMLAGVWQYTMTDKIWSRVRAAATILNKHERTVEQETRRRSDA